MNSEMRIGRRIVLICGLLMVLTAVSGIGALVNIGRISSALDVVADDALAGVSSCSKLESALLEMRGDILKHIGATDAAQMTAIEQSLVRLKSDIGTGLEHVSKTVTTAEERDINAKVRPALDRYYQLCDQVLPISRASRNEEAYRLYAEGTQLFEAAKDAVRAETEFNRRLGKSATANAKDIESSARWTIWLLLALSTVLGGVLATVLVHKINRALIETSEALADGAAQVASAAGQVSASSQALAQGSSEQAASLEETSASTEQINALASQNSDKTRSAAAEVEQAQAGFKTAVQALAEMERASQEVTASSTKISKIIKTIDEIAFQTNILALNAAVEAARAGESGMGFAVVADEVRSLAQRSAQAARDTAVLIEDSIAKSKQGQDKTNRVGEEIRAIALNAAEVKRLVDEVNQSTGEQARGISQVATAITGMQQVTQSTAASAEEGAAAATELTAQSASLRVLVSRLTAMVQGSDRAPQTV
jgi:methyl-accepting chemotaxis protein